MEGRSASITKMEERRAGIIKKAKFAYITKMEKIRAGICQRAYDNITESFLDFSNYFDNEKTDKIHKIVFALHQIKLTPTLYFHDHVLKLDTYDEREKPLLVAYFDLLIHLQFLFGTYLINIKNSNALSKFQQSTKEISYNCIKLFIDATHYGIPDDNSIDINPHTGKGWLAKDKKSINKWLTEQQMTKRTEQIYDLASQTAYLLYSNTENGEIITKKKNDIHKSIDGNKSVINNLRRILSTFEKNDRDELLSICSPNTFLPEGYKSF
jgi:hypothetical protein